MERPLAAPGHRVGTGSSVRIRPPCLRDRRLLPLLPLLLALAGPVSACLDPVVLVHGNGGRPADFDPTVAELRARGWPSTLLIRPEWGSRLCVACNDHDGSEELPVRQALASAVAQSCSGRIDVIAHSMGASLAALQIVKLGIADRVDVFIAIGGAFRGLWSCGVYPWHVATATCGAHGLSVGSPLLAELAARAPFARRGVSFRSHIDEVVCATGTCLVGGEHSSRMPGEVASYSFALGHRALLSHTTRLQAELLGAR
ncbi:MAG: lipase [Xanthomonadales bacterium]|nr:lipase [Xanthomonadales bacterium]